jgi:membrane protease YdiL (CAAX protease family)
VVNLTLTKIDLLKKILYPNIVIFSTFAITYITLITALGYNYELHIISTIIFTILSVIITLKIFRDKPENFNNITKTKIILTILTIIVLAEELLLNSIYATYGFALSILGLILLPVLAVSLSRNNEQLRTALEAIAFIFATRVTLSPFPTGTLNISTFLPTIYTLILISLVLYLTYRKIPAKDVRLSTGKYSIKLQLTAGFGTGIFIGITEYFILKPQPIIISTSPIQTLAYIIIVPATMVGIAEELLFRGLIQSSLERIMPTWQAIGITSIMFGLMHIGWMNPLEVLLAYGAGITFGYLTVVTDSLTTPIIAHASGNIILYIIALQI